MASSGYEITSDEIINIKCCSCAEKNKITEADKYCIDCKDYYCLTCVDAHRLFPVMKGHKILDKADFRTLGPDGSLPSFPTMRCSLHPTKVVDMFCKQHDEVACASCIALSHRNCKKIHSIPEEVDSLSGQTNLRDIEKKIRELQIAMITIKKAKEEKGKQLKQRLEKATDAVKAFKRELQTLMDNIEQETISEIRNEVCAAEATLEAEIKEADKVMDSLNELNAQLKKAAGNKAQEFVCDKTIKRLTNKVTEQENMQQISWMSEISLFTADQTIKAFILQIQKLGKVEGFEIKLPTSKPITTLYKVKQRREISAKLSNDTKDCGIFGSCVTNDGCLLLTDYYNKKLKCMDMSTETITDYREFQTAPVYICKVNKKQAAVTFANNTVQFVSMEGRMTATHSFHADHLCYRLAQHDQKLFIADDSKTMYIHDMQGKVLQKLSTDTSGSHVFKAIRQIAVSEAGDKVFVADNECGLITTDGQGNYLSTHAEFKDLGCQGVCTDNWNVFVAGWRSNSIVQIGHDFKMLGELAKLQQPLSICFDHHKKWLFVTQNSNNNITVLELE